MNGYYVVHLTGKKNNKKKFKSHRVHRLLAHIFIPKKNTNYDVVNHIDENKLNYYLNNLEWTTRLLNIQHSP